MIEIIITTTDKIDETVKLSASLVVQFKVPLTYEQVTDGVVVFDPLVIFVPFDGPYDDPEP